MVSSVSAKPVSPTEVTNGRYWIENVLRPVLFSDALIQICNDQISGSSPVGTIVEIGAHSTLRSAVKETLQQLRNPESISYTHVLKRHEKTARTILQMVGLLHSRGHIVSVTQVNELSILQKPGQISRVLTSLPQYAFNHSQTFRTVSAMSRNLRHRQWPRHDILGAPVPDWDTAQPRWRNTVRLKEVPWLADHRV
jgi:acyl transferase domain-containing protein